MQLRHNLQKDYHLQLWKKNCVQKSKKSGKWCVISKHAHHEVRLHYLFQLGIGKLLFLFLTWSLWKASLMGGDLLMAILTWLFCLVQISITSLRKGLRLLEIILASVIFRLQNWLDPQGHPAEHQRTFSICFVCLVFIKTFRYPELTESQLVFMTDHKYAIRGGGMMMSSKNVCVGG